MPLSRKPAILSSRQVRHACIAFASECSTLLRWHNRSTREGLPQHSREALSRYLISPATVKQRNRRSSSAKSVQTIHPLRRLNMRHCGGCRRRSSSVGSSTLFTLVFISPTALQYAPLPGLPELRQAVAQHAEATHPGISVDPATEAIITLGATEALSSAMLALLNPGDEARSSKLDAHCDARIRRKGCRCCSPWKAQRLLAVETLWLRCAS